MSKSKEQTKEEKPQSDEQLKHIPREEMEQILRLYRGKRVSPFFEEPIILDKYDVACMKLREALESIAKFVSYYLRKIEQRLGLKIEYATSIRYNENFLPTLIVEILGVYFAEDVRKARQQT